MGRERGQKEVSPEDVVKIERALERCGASGEFPDLRVRAYIYLLMDGAIRPKVARSLNIEDVVASPTAPKINVHAEVNLAASDQTRQKPIRFYMSKRVRAAIMDYLIAVRRDGWLPSTRLEGPLFLSLRYKGQGARLGTRTPLNMWANLLRDHVGEDLDYQLDDLVYSGRLATLAASGGDVKTLQEMADISAQWSERYYAEWSAKKTSESPADVLKPLNRPKRD